MKPNESAQLSPAKRSISASLPISYAMQDVESTLLYGDNIGLSPAINPNGDKTARSIIDIAKA